MSNDIENDINNDIEDNDIDNTLPTNSEYTQESFKGIGTLKPTDSDNESDKEENE